MISDHASRAENRELCGNVLGTGEVRERVVGGGEHVAARRRARERHPLAEREKLHAALRSARLAGGRTATGAGGPAPEPGAGAARGPGAADRRRRTGRPRAAHADHRLLLRRSLLQRLRWRLVETHEREQTLRAVRPGEPVERDDRLTGICCTVEYRIRTV